MIYTEKPEDFKSGYENVGCFVNCGKEILILHRQDHKSEGNTWGLPAGSIEKGEKPIDAVFREIKEETGNSIPIDKIDYVEKLYVRYPTYDQVFYLFNTELENKFEVKINKNEHKDFIWTTPEKALDLDLIGCLDLVIKYFYKI